MRNTVSRPCWADMPNGAGRSTATPFAGVDRQLAVGAVQVELQLIGKGPDTGSG
jgi:hypothetical protein